MYEEKMDEYLTSLCYLFYGWLHCNLDAPMPVDDNQFAKAMLFMIQRRLIGDGKEDGDNELLETLSQIFNDKLKSGNDGKNDGEWEECDNCGKEVIDHCKCNGADLK